MNKRVLFIAIATIIVGVLVVFQFGKATESSLLTAEVKEGELAVTVSSTGELQPKSSTAIRGPMQLREYGIYQVKIQELVPEGSIVKKGDFVAELDKSDLTNKLMERQNELAQLEAQFLQTRLDTTLTLRAARDEIVNMDYTLQEKELQVQQSKYEPPATIRQVQLDLEKTLRSQKQAKENYKLKKRQAQAKIDEVAAKLLNARQKVDGIQGLMNQLTISAPEPGMVVYERDWSGTRIKAGSQINMWDPTVATLPDLSIMLSKTYVNEIEIRKIKVGQIAIVSLDAFPDKKLSGKVSSVSNIGEKRPNSDAKVFQVEIEIVEKDTILKPSMTTSNKIISSSIKKALYIPLESVFNAGDSLSFVYAKGSNGGWEKKEIKTGASNESFVSVSEGLSKGETVAMIAPEGYEEKAITRLPKTQKLAAKKAK